MLGETLEVVAGDDGLWNQAVRNTDGTPFTLFTGSETLSAVLWTGEDQAVITPGPTATWTDAPNGAYALALAASATTPLTPGIYRIMVEVQATSQRFTLFNGSLRVYGRPGSASAFKTPYCSIGDMRREYANINKLLNPDSDVTGFAEQIQDARDWIENLGQRHYRGSVAIDPARFAVFADGFWRSGRDNVWLQEQFDADALILRRDVVQAVACYAVARVLLAQTDGKNAENYQHQGGRLAVRADAIASQITLQLDTNGDGLADVAIDLGSADRLDG